MSKTNLSRSLNDIAIPTLPPSAYYISDFITVAEEGHLLDRINSVPIPTWRTLSHRRLQAHPSPLSPSNSLLEAPLPSWLVEPIIPRLQSLSLQGDSCSQIFGNSPHKEPNHVLINEYLTGQGIMPHEDGDAYWPVVCTVSLGAGLVYNAFSKDKTGDEHPKKWRIFQEPRSLLITKNEMYKECLHGIESVQVDLDVTGGQGGVANWDLLRKETREQMEENEWKNVRGTRVSLTFRDVIKVKKLGKGMKFMGR